PPLASTLPPPSYSLFPYTTLFRSLLDERPVDPQRCRGRLPRARRVPGRVETRLLRQRGAVPHPAADDLERLDLLADARGEIAFRSEEHTSELQSRFDLVCRLLLEK